MTGASAESAAVLCTVRNRIGHVVLNRPAAYNALTLEMVRVIHEALRSWETDPAVDAIVFRANGDKAFCAGGDIRALWESYRAGDSLHRDFFVEEYALDIAIHRYPKPRIAIMDGLTLGGGMGMAQGTVRRIVTDRSRIGMPEVGIGFFPDVGGSYFLSRLPGRLGPYLALRGAQIGPADAIYCGLADRFIRHEKVGELIRALDNVPWSGQPPGKEFVHWIDAMTAPSAGDSPLADAPLADAPLADAPLAAIRNAVDEHFAQPSVAAITASLAAEARPDLQPWAKETLDAMAKHSPLMMCVTLEQLRRGRALALEECFDMELVMTLHTFEQGDFPEGVRALIVDKDRQPRWQHATLAAVTDGDIERFFSVRRNQGLFSR